MLSHPQHLIALLLLHISVINAFPHHHAPPLKRRQQSGTDDKSMITSKLTPSPLLRRLTHHYRQHGRTSFLCLQNLHYHPDTSRGYPCDYNNRNSRSIEAKLSLASHQLRRQHGTLSSTLNDDTQNDIPPTIPNDSSRLTTDTPLQSKCTANDAQDEIILTLQDGSTVKHWFTYELPEGFCVGVVSCDDHDDRAVASSSSSAAAASSSLIPTISSAEVNNSATFESSTEQLLLLHPQEYQWGQTNMSKGSSRTCYYLGRVALRLALKRLLLDDHHDYIMNVGDDQSAESSSEAIPSKATSSDHASATPSSATTTQTQLNSSQRRRRTQLYKAITSKPITKDSHGRPILPEMVVGSISHKGGECAVGLATFHSLFYDSVVGDVAVGTIGSAVVGMKDEDSVDIKEEEIQWREDCPIYYDDDDDDNSDINNSNRERMGIGVDIEYIDGVRGERLKRKILTENERSELGGLVEEAGVSIGEEVMLRFSLKESVYKAMHPILCEYVGFQEAEITPLPDGTARVTLNLQSGSHERLGIVVRSATWRKLKGGRFFLTTALVGVDSSSSS